MGGGDGRTLMQSCVSSSDELHCVKLGSINNAKLILRSPTRNPVIQIDKKKLVCMDFAFSLLQGGIA